MFKENIDLIKQHIKTHTERSVDDRSAVSVLETFLRTDGKINHNFASDDKWPNIDGSFEFVSNPNLSRRPEQNFIVQIKGTSASSEEDGVIKYQLKSLGFPAFIYDEITLDPGILFVVLNPRVRGQERLFWKYISTEFLSSIDFSKDSKTINFTSDDEIENTDESIEIFCDKLEYIANQHSFVKRLETRSYSVHEVKKIIMACNQEIIETIDRMDIVDLTRDDISKRMLRYLEDMCKSTLLLNTINMGYENPNLRLAWEKALLNRETKYLCTFLKGLRYIGGRIPEDGQSERLMLKYYDFLWQIRKFLHINFNIEVLDNLEKFPLNIDKIDNEYYSLLASAIESTEIQPRALCASRFYVQKKTPFFVGKERYYEITLQLSGMYATKYNRITVYSKDNIDSGYSVQISYIPIAIELWGISSNIKVVTNWQVSIEPNCLNKLGKIVCIPIKLSAKYGEYQSLMAFLTQTGINLLDFIDLGNDQFKQCLSSIYNDVNTNYFKEILIELQKNYSKNSTISGRFTIRYLILHLKEDVLEGVLPSTYQPKQLKSPLYLSSKCYPFEKNPYIANLVGRKTTSTSQLTDIQNVTGMKLYNKCHPYVLLKSLINTTREIYFPSLEIASQQKIDEFNSSLDSWQRSSGDIILQEGELVCIESFEKKTIELLKRLSEYSTRGNKGQKELNSRFIKNIESVKSFDDPLKKQALQNIFTDSQIALIYGAAGTGKLSL